MSDDSQSFFKSSTLGPEAQAAQLELKKKTEKEIADRRERARISDQKRAEALEFNKMVSENYGEEANAPKPVEIPKLFRGNALTKEDLMKTRVQGACFGQSENGSSENSAGAAKGAAKQAEPTFRLKRF